MSDRDGGAVVQKFFEAMNDHDLDQVVSVASEDIEFVDVAAGEEIYGREQWRRYCGRYLKAFPDLRHTEGKTAFLRFLPVRSRRRAGRSR